MDLDPDVFDATLKIPNTCVVFGSSNCGKTELIVREILLKQEEVFGFRVEKIYFIYTIYQPIYDVIKEKIPRVQFIKNFKEIPTNNKEPKIAIFDDKILDFQNNPAERKNIFDIFFRLFHHLNIFAIIVLQVIHGHSLRQLVVNAGYRIIFPPRNDCGAMNYLSRSMFPDYSSSFLRDALQDAGKEKFGYLLLDSTPTQHPLFQVRNFITLKPNAKIYRPKDG